MEDDTFTKQRQCLDVQHMEEDDLLTRQRQCVCSQRLNWGGSRSSSAQAEKYFYNTYDMFGLHDAIVKCSSSYKKISVK